MYFPYMIVIVVAHYRKRNHWINFYHIGEKPQPVISTSANQKAIYALGQS